MKLKSNEKGVTLLEVVVCMMIVMIVVGPMLLNFMTAKKTMTSAERVNEATGYSEQLIAQVKERITQDIILMQEIEGNRKVYASGSTEQNRYTNYIEKYLKETKGFTGNIYTFLEQTQVAFADEYNTDLFDYDVMIWPVKSDFITSGSKFTVNKDNIKLEEGTITLASEATFDKDRYTVETEPITFTIDSGTYAGFIDDKDRYNYADATLTNAQIVKLKVEADDTITSVDTDDTNMTVISESSVKTVTNTASHKTKVINITLDAVGDFATTSASDVPDMSILELDMTAVIRNLSGDLAANRYSVNIKNNTGKYLQVKVIRNYVKTDSTTDETKVDDLLHIVVKNIGDCHTSVEYIDDVRPTMNYLVAVVIREKNAVIGQNGKIVKKMVSLYSYDQTINERR